MFCLCPLLKVSQSSTYLNYWLIRREEKECLKIKKYTNSIFNIQFIKVKLTKHVFLNLLEDTMPLLQLVSQYSSLLQLSRPVSSASETNNVLALSREEYLAL